MPEKDTIVKVTPSLLIPNKTKLEIYQVPANYEEIKLNIEKHGILEPLLVNKKTNVVISGNLRLQIAIELGLEEIPVIFQIVDEKEMNVKSISTNQQRVKSYSDILKEIEFFEKQYPVTKGQRTDLNPELKKIKKERDAFLKKHSRTTREKVKAIASLGEELFGKESDEFKGLFKSLDNGKTTLNGLFQHLDDLTKRKQNALVIPEKFEILREKTKIYNQSSENMSQVEDGSVNAIITSPPYLQMRVYGNGEDELGQENEIEVYLLNLMKVFKECYRVLDDKGSLFVNINDCVLGGQYQAVPHYFVIEMLKLGWILNDEILWIKQNPTYTRGKRSVRSHEPIFHFVKTSDFYYNDSWLKDISDEEARLAYGLAKSSPKVKSGIDMRDGVLKTNVSSTAELRKKCKEEGFHLTHSATFPLDVPAICGLLSTKEGDTILDCFTGTSTVGEFSLSFNRRFIGYDMNPEFIKASEVRLHKYENYYIPSGTWELISKKARFNLENLKEQTYDIKTALEMERTKPVPPELKKSFGTFSKAYNDCFRVIQQM
ncbi:MAG: DNA methyltransferase [Bacteroidota bacterium]